MSIIPHVNNGLLNSSPTPDDYFRNATANVSTGRTKEVHQVQRYALETGKSAGEPITYTFDWVYAAPNKDAHFT